MGLHIYAYIKLHGRAITLQYAVYGVCVPVVCRHNRLLDKIDAIKHIEDCLSVACGNDHHLNGNACNRNMT
jgi:hypothetical protein